jgi:GxxExxY protein
MYDADHADVSEQVIGAAIAVHRALGPGLFESIYERALAVELTSLGLLYKAQLEIPVVYRGQTLGAGFRLDLLVSDRLVVEIKSVARFDSIHLKQMITYLRLSGLKSGLLINFNSARLMDGLKRVSV